MNAIETVETPDLKSGLPRLAPGDTVRVHVRVKETSVKEEKGKAKETERERVQVKLLAQAPQQIGVPQADDVDPGDGRSLAVGQGLLDIPRLVFDTGVR